MLIKTLRVTECSKGFEGSEKGMSTVMVVERVVVLVEEKGNDQGKILSRFIFDVSGSGLVLII